MIQVCHERLVVQRFPRNALGAQTLLAGLLAVYSGACAGPKASPRRRWLLASGPPSRLVVDANPILAALLGGRARRVFFETPIREFAVPEVVLSEVREHIPRLATKLGRMPALLEYALDLLPLRPYPARSYRATMLEATRRIGSRDPGLV